MRIFVLLLSIIYLVGCQSENKPSSEVFTIDTSLPLEERILLVDMDGNKNSLASYKGKTVFLNFWATWCKPCIKEMPSIDQARKKLAAENVVFIAASDEKLEKIKKFAENNEFGFDIVQVQGDIFDLDIKALPTTFIIDADGKIVYNEIGAREWHEPENLKLVTDLFE